MRWLIKKVFWRFNKDKGTGFFWHVHHDRCLVEYCYDYQERVDCIIETKPLREISTRLRLFQPVKGELPKGFVKAAESVLWAKAYDANRAYKEELEALHKKECLNCPWDGKTIFPKGGQK